ncbi:MAG: peptidoglycan editing factor PgeF, partial [Chloroflexi bacterium]|nr:peptidoglycan editing factor PgeF [Chloroflexota bacterium]
GREQRGTIVRDVDALLTNQTGIPLMLRYADCVPLMLFDPVHRAIGLVHSGWRGTVAKIVSKSVRAMVDAFGTRPGELVAGIAPSIGPCCYRVGPDLTADVRRAFRPSDDVLIEQADGSVHFDLWQSNARQLRELGVGQIEIAGVCTAHRVDDFYSWRAENAKTGRFGAIVCLV